MVVGLLLSAIAGGLAAAGFSAVGGHSLGHALLAFELGGLLSTMLFLGFLTRYQDLS